MFFTAEAIKFWKGLAVKSKATFNTYDYIEGYPIIVLKWKGSNPSLSSIVLLSHIDVVPVANEVIFLYTKKEDKRTLNILEN